MLDRINSGDEDGYKVAEAPALMVSFRTIFTYSIEMIERVC